MAPLSLSGISLSHFSAMCTSTVNILLLYNRELFRGSTKHVWYLKSIAFWVGGSHMGVCVRTYEASEVGIVRYNTEQHCNTCEI